MKAKRLQHANSTRQGLSTPKTTKGMSQMSNSLRHTIKQATIQQTSKGENLMKTMKMHQTDRINQFQTLINQEIGEISLQERRKSNFGYSILLNLTESTRIPSTNDRAAWVKLRNNLKWAVEHEYDDKRKHYIIMMYNMVDINKAGNDFYNARYEKLRNLVIGKEVESYRSLDLVA